MKTTARILSELVAVALGLSAVLAYGQAPGAGSAPLYGSPAASSTPEEARRRCDDLLQRARQAMTEGDVAAARSLVEQAERLGVDYGPLHLGDTPKRLRAELEQQSFQQPAGMAGLGRLLVPGTAPAANTSNPFATLPGNGALGQPDAKTQAKSYILQARTALAQQNLAAATYWYHQAEKQNAAFGPTEDSPARLAADLRRMGAAVDQAQTPGSLASQPAVMPLPPVGTPGPVAAIPTGPLPSTASAPAVAARVPSDRLLVEARRALALGDVRTASAKLEQAKAMGVVYGPSDDTPDRVARTISSYVSLKEQEKQSGNTEGYRHRYARVLMEQAQGLLYWREYDEAERLTGVAARLGAGFTAYEMQPGELLSRIAAERSRGRQPGTLPQSVNSAPSLAAKQRAVELVRQARQAMQAGDLRLAEDYARQAERMQIPDAVFAPGEERPSAVLQEVLTARYGSNSGVIQAGAVTSAIGNSTYDPRASRAFYDQSSDRTRNTLAGNAEPMDAALQPPAGNAGQAMTLYQQGETALRSGDSATALQLFRQAYPHMQELDPVTAQRLQDYLQMLAAPADMQRVGGSSPTLDSVAADQKALARALSAQIGEHISKADQLRATNPKLSLGTLEESRRIVESSGVDAESKAQLLRRLDRELSDIRKYLEDNRARIDLKEKAALTEADIRREEQVKVEVQEKVALMVDEYNQLMEEHRFAEALVVAKRARELDPNNPFTEQLLRNANLIWSLQSNLATNANKQDGFLAEMQNVNTSSVPFNSDMPYMMPDAREWATLTANRVNRMRERGPRRSERELEIEQKLKTPVMLQFEQAPLSLVMDQLAKLADVNLHLDPQGLAEEGVTTDAPVSVKLNHEISLQSALRLILEPLHLSYVIKDEVLKITSEQLRNGEVYPVVYNVADLVTPIPNFVPSPRSGLAGALADAMATANPLAGGGFGASAAPLAVLANNRSTSGTVINPAVLAQMSGSSPTGAVPSNVANGFGPGGLGGGSMADFDSLIDLITSTIQPTTWDEVGGPGSIQEFETNLSLVITQTQQVHEQIVDLLAQLRRLQDLQVTIEVRFITLNDNFFERIGVDFDFQIDDDIDRPFQVFGRIPEGDDDDDDDEDITVERERDTRDVDHENDTLAVGLAAPGVFSADLDIPFSQGSYDLAVPQFGGFDPSAGASIGFAILSDIEAFFFVNAAQGSRRSNLLQAPKVTLFNGQQAFVSDQSQSPFVVSVIPVVGDFAAAQQPVIVVLSEGTFLTVQAVVSDDRRFVRLTLLPFFSRIGDVDTFTFSGTETTTENTSEEGIQTAPNDNSKKNSEKTTSRAGTTVQLPTFSFVSVTTTVSVPDGGTVLLGGIKRLSEGRNEFGVPILSKLPYINRLFRNVGVGRESQSLMMMVTPRIIIQEEEEERLGIQSQP